MTDYVDVGKTNVAKFVIENNILKGAVESINEDQKVAQSILDALNEDPNHVSQIDAETGATTTFREMKDRSIHCALWLKNLGIGPHDFVVACTHNHLDSYVPVLATFFVDAIFSAWNDNITLHTARRFISQFKPKAIFTCEKTADLLLEAANLEKLNIKFVVFGKHLNMPSLDEILNIQTKEEVDNFIVVNIKSSEEAAYVTMSSGSTGFPKGVMRSNMPLLFSSMLRHTKFDSAKSKILWYSTMDWGSGVLLLLTAIIRKQTRILPSICEAENLLQIIEKYQVHEAMLPYVILPSVAKFDLAQKYDLQSVKHILVGGSKISKEIIESLKKIFPNAFLTHCYGTTETGAVSISTLDCKHSESVGFIVSDCQIKFVDLKTGNTLGPNQQGELYIKSRIRMIEYYNNPEATKEAFDEDGWYRSGDIGYYSDNGEIFVVDRAKEVIKYKSHQISPAELEEILLSHPEILDAVVVGLPHKDDGDWPVALCRKAPQSNVTEDELMQLISVLEDYKKLRGGIYFVDDFEYTSSGKIARNEMKLLATKLLHDTDSQ